MIKQVVECNYCHKQSPVQVVGVFMGAALPKDWYTVIKSTGSIKHYCSRTCMVKDEETNE